MEQQGFSPSTVRELVTQHPKVFDLNGERVELRPEIAVCPQHSGPRGCLDRSACRDLHICQQYLRNSCKDVNCILGHKWRTDHNTAALHSYHLEHIPVPILQKILFRSLRTATPVGKITICPGYNAKGCTQDDCTSLHVCRSFVTSRTKCQENKCQLNHDLLTPECSKILAAHGLSTNESPRDIAVAILAANSDICEKGVKQNVSDSQEPKPASQNKHENTEKRKEGSGMTTQYKDESHSSQDSDSGSESETESSDSEGKSSKTRKPLKSRKRQYNKENDDNSETDDSDSDKSCRSVNTADKANQLSRKQPPTSATSPSKGTPTITKTLWAQDIQGNVAVPEICYYSVEGMCKYEGSGCKRLHSSEHFHWQVMKQNENWYNLPEQQVITLERSFCNPAEDGVDLPRLDPTHLKASARGLLILMGRDTWSADFKLMTLTNSSQSQTLKIRRLCTQYIDGQEVKPANFLWYFLDIKKNWVQYGLTDTTGETDLVVKATSIDIEKHYRQNPASRCSIKSSKFTYILDFQSMTQTNQRTNVAREVRRRPEPHLKDLKQDSEDEKKPKDLPLSWELMQPEERVRSVTLAPTSSEYQAVTALLNGRISTSDIIKIDRVQNPYLWRAFENKISEMSSVVGNKTPVDIRQIFHGTKSEVISSICAENFDWRLHGSSTGQMYGRGTYFSTDAAYSYKYCVPDAASMKYMFVARVAVGAFTIGKSSMVRPPQNPATGMLFDSTVDRELNPGIIVKYDKQEYYPEYVLTLT